MLKKSWLTTATFWKAENRASSLISCFRYPVIAAILITALLITHPPLALSQPPYLQPIEITPLRLVEAYKNDFYQADTLYTGKLLIVTGRIKTIRPPQRTYNYRQDKIYAYITMDAGRNRPLVVYFWDWEAARVNSSQVGSTISVMGFCQGVTPQLSLVGACVYPGGCGGPRRDFNGPYFKTPPTPPRQR